MLTPVICGSCKATAEVNLLTTAACGNCGSDDLDFFEGSVKEADFLSDHIKIIPVDVPPPPKCPECGKVEGFYRRADYCSNCGYKGPKYQASLNGVAFFASRVESELGEPERQMCPKCGTANYNPKAGYCPQCGFGGVPDHTPGPEKLRKMFPIGRQGSVPDPREDEWDGTAPMEQFPEPTTFGSLHEATPQQCYHCGRPIKRDPDTGQLGSTFTHIDDGQQWGSEDEREHPGTYPTPGIGHYATPKSHMGSLRVESEDIASVIRGNLKQTDDRGFSVPSELVDALTDDEAKQVWTKLVGQPIPPLYYDTGMGEQHARNYRAHNLVTDTLIRRQMKSGSQHEAAYPPEGSKVRHSSPQAWRRLREHVTESELRDIAKDIAGHAGGDHESIAHALIHHDWQEGYHQGSLHEAAVKRHHYNDLVNRPTQSQGQADDLKLDDGEHRWWVARSSKEDGEPFEHTIHVEKHNPDTGGWDNHISYDGDNPERAPIHHLGVAQCQYPGCSNQPRSNSTYCPAHDVWAQHLRDVNSKLEEIVAGVLATNPGMQHEAAMAIATETLKRFPRMAASSNSDEVRHPHDVAYHIQRTHTKGAAWSHLRAMEEKELREYHTQLHRQGVFIEPHSAGHGVKYAATTPPPEQVEDMPHTLQRMVQDFQRTHPRQPVDV